MKYFGEMTDASMLEEIGSRLAATRLSKDLSQEDVAREAGIGLRTLQRMESGEVATRLSSFVGVCRVLGLRDRFSLLLPEPAISPIDQLKLHGKRRTRASGLRQPDVTSLREDPVAWKWGDGK